MKLTYRGVQYNRTRSVIEVEDTFEKGKYRGIEILFRIVKKNPVQQPALDLICRVVAYRTAVFPGEVSFDMPTDRTDLAHAQTGQKDFL
jgi:hypothetical protein